MTLRYDPVGRKCSGRAQPGALALRKVLLPRFGGRDGGIYNCRPNSGGGGLSTHGEGRAGDQMFALIGGKVDPRGTALANFLTKYADFLGIQRVIWDSHEWGGVTSSGKFEDYWEQYSGDSDHRDHVHWELNWNAALTLTEDKILQLFESEPPVPPQEQEEAEMLQTYVEFTDPSNPKRKDAFYIGLNESAVWHKVSQDGGKSWPKTERCDDAEHRFALGFVDPPQEAPGPNFPSEFYLRVLVPGRVLWQFGWSDAKGWVWGELGDQVS